ncbi:MAG: cytochrome c family protein [Rhizobiales bacterium]|nr:cytochrome c family protein [Hyphomicrobiales bacterium]
MIAVLVALGGGAAHADGDPDKGAKVFKKCMPCHRVGPGAAALVGPPLNGVVGAKAGEVPNYAFSDALKNSGLVFDEATLAKWLRNPRQLVPGNRMTFAGLTKDEDIADVIAYLKTFGPDGNPPK